MKYMGKGTKVKQRTSIWTRDFLVIFAVNIFTAAGFHILTPILPKYAVTLGYSSAAAGGIGAAFTITAILIRPFSGTITASRRMKRMLMLALAMICLCCVCYASFASMAALLAARLLHGVGWGLATTLTATLAVRALPKEQMGRGIGVFGLASVLGQALAPNLGLTLIERLGYSQTFLLAAVFSLAALLACAAICSKDNEEESRPRPLPREWVAKEALFPGMLMGIMTMAVSSVSYFLALHAEQRAIANAGAFFTIYAFSLFLIRPLFGSLADRVDKRLIFVPVSMMMIASLLLIADATSLKMLLPVSVLYGLSYGGIQPTVHAWCIEVTPAERYASANSTFYSCFDLGMCVGSVIGGAIADAIGYAAMYRVLCLPVVVAMTLALADYMRKREKKSGQNTGEVET